MAQRDLIGHKIVSMRWEVLQDTWSPVFTLDDGMIVPIEFGSPGGFATPRLLFGVYNGFDFELKKEACPHKVDRSLNGRAVLRIGKPVKVLRMRFGWFEGSCSLPEVPTFDVTSPVWKLDDGRSVRFNMMEMPGEVVAEPVSSTVRAAGYSGRAYIKASLS